MPMHLSDLIDISNQQFQESSFKNLFCTADNQFHFNPTTVRAIHSLGRKLDMISDEDTEILFLNYTEGFIRTFHQTDPYLNFGSKDNLAIRQIYSLLLRDIIDEFPIREIEERHYERIRLFIRKTNPGVYQINHNPDRRAKHFECAEYSSVFQLNLLDIDSRYIIEPVLDIGCGEHGYLVEYFRGQHMAAYGIDCLKKSSHYFYDDNWLEFSYGHERWGTIISHLSFNSHFLHHFLLNDGLDILFAQTYMNILESLVPGGHWIYTPAVHFMEDLLPHEKYVINRTPINANFYKTVVTKL